MKASTKAAATGGALDSRLRSPLQFNFASRERQAVELLASGLPYKYVSAEMGITVASARSILTFVELTGNFTSTTAAKQLTNAMGFATLHQRRAAVFSTARRGLEECCAFRLLVGNDQSLVRRTEGEWSWLQPTKEKQ